MQISPDSGAGRYVFRSAVVPLADSVNNLLFRLIWQWRTGLSAKIAELTYKPELRSCIFCFEQDLRKQEGGTKDCGQSSRV